MSFICVPGLVRADRSELYMSCICVSGLVRTNHHELYMWIRFGKSTFAELYQVW